jgi:hypothetical protein
MLSIVLFLAKNVYIQNLHDATLAPLSILRIQDGVQDGVHFKQTPRTPLLFNIEQ